MMHKLTRLTTRMLAFLFAVFAASEAWANLVAEWNGDLADGSVKGKYTMSCRSGDSARVSFATGNATLTKHTDNPASHGVIVSWPNPASDLYSFTSKKMTVVVQYSGLDIPSGNTSLLGALWGDESTEYLIRTSGSNASTGIAVGVTSSDSGSQYTKSNPNYPAPTKGRLLACFSGDSSERPGIDVYFSKYENGAYGAYDNVRYWNGSGQSVENGVFYGLRIGGSISRIGSYHRPGMVVEAVQIFDGIVTFPATANMTADANWSDLTWDVTLPATPEDNSITYVVDIPSTAASTVTLTFDEAVSGAKEIIFNIASGKTLKIAGSNVPTCQFSICGGGTVSTAKTGVFGTTPKVDVAYPSVWELTNSTDDTNDKDVDCSKITGNGTMKLTSTGSKWRTLPWGAGKMWANTLGLATEEQNGVIISEGNRCWEIGSLSGSYGIRSDYGYSYGQSQRQVRFTQSRNTEWSGKFHNDRIDKVYVAGASGATEKTLTISSSAVDADNPLTVEKSGSVKLTGKWKGNLTVQGEFGGYGSVENATTVSIAVGATLRADWGTPTVNVKPTFAEGIVDVVVSTLPDKDTATKIISGTSFEVGTYANTYALVKTSDGTSKTYAEVSAQADGVYVTVTDVAIYANLKTRPKYAYELNGSYTSSGETAMTMSGGSIAAGDYVAGAVLSLGTNAGQHYSSGGFSYSPNYTYATDWTIVTYVMAPGANQTVFAMAGNSGTSGMIGLRHASGNQVKAFTASSTDLTGVTLTSDPTAGFHLYAIVYTASDGKVKMSVDGGEFTEGVTFAPGSANTWQFGGIYQGGVTDFAVNATSGQMDSFRFYSCALTKSDLESMLASDYPTVAKIGSHNFPTLGVAVADAASAETVVEVVANCTETTEIALSKNLVLTVANGASYTVSPAISGAFALTKQGAGMLKLAGANTYSGGTTVTEGILWRNSATAFGGTGSTVTVSGTGTVHLGGQYSSSASYPFTIEGDGDTGHECAIMGSTGTVPEETGIARVALSGDATIGALSFGDGTGGSCNCTLNGHTLKMAETVNGYNVKFYYSGTSDGTETVPEGDGGTLEIASGTYTARYWSNWGKNVTLKVDAGATYASDVDGGEGDTRCTFKNVVNNGTVSMNSTHPLNVLGGTYSGTGTINNLRLQDGSTLDLSDRSTTLATSVFTQGGAMTIDLGERTVAAGDVLLSASSSFTCDEASYTCSPVLVNKAVKPIGSTLKVVDTSLGPWNTGSGTWSSTSYNGSEGTYNYGTADVTFSDNGESTSTTTVTIGNGDTISVGSLEFNNEVTPIVITGGTIASPNVVKTGAADVTINSALTMSGYGISVDDGANLTLSAVTGTTGGITIDGDESQSGTVRLTEASADSLTVGVATIGANQTLKVTALGNKTLASNASGEGTIELAGNVEYTVNGSLSSNIKIDAGTTAKMGAVASFGNSNDGAYPSGKTITVYGTVDLNGKEGVNNYVLAGGTIKNTGSGMGNNARQTSSLTLTANSQAVATAAFGLIGSQYGATTLALDGYTLTKTGSEKFWLCHTTATGTGDAKILVSEGALYVTPGSGQGGTANLCDIQVPVELANNSTLWIDSNSSFAEIRGYGTFGSWNGSVPVVTKIDFSSGLAINSQQGASGNLQLAASGATIKLGSTQVVLQAVASSGETTIEFADAVSLSERTLITWTSEPSGTFVFSNGTEKMVEDGIEYTLVKDASGLALVATPGYAVDVGDGYVVVPSAWITANCGDEVSSASDLTKTGDNGYTYIVSYALGLDPAGSTSKPTLIGGYTGSNVSFAMPNVTPPAGVTLQVVAQGSTDGSAWANVAAGAGETTSVTVTGDGSTTVSGISFAPSFGVSDAVKYYRLNITIQATP